MTAETVPAWVALGGAAITAAAGFLGAIAGGVVQTRQSQAARHADWQNRRREIYGDFLDAARKFSDSPDDERRNAFRSAGDRLMLAASKRLRGVVADHLADPDPQRLRAGWTELVDELNADIRRQTDTD